MPDSILLTARGCSRSVFKVIKWKSAACLLYASLLWAAVTFAQSPVTVTVDAQSRGYLILGDFAGVGFETFAELPNHNSVSGNLFSSTNTQLITLFTNTGIRNLRLGGGTVDGPHPAIPSRPDIDSLFGFARAAGIKVIYSLPLLDAKPADAADTAQYIWNHYRPYLYCFSIGNEPNEPPYRDARVGAIRNYAEFLAAWRTFAAAITNVVPDAKFTGPEAGGWDWAPEFATDEKDLGRVVLITHHQYFGGKPFINHGRDEMPVKTAIDNMLSRNWVTNKYPDVYKKTSVRIQPTGFPSRMTEANDYLRGVTNASDAFASALWALDYLHWWAAHGLAGVNFHNNQWLKTDTFYLDRTTGAYRINPKAYGIRAFDLGSHGWTKFVAVNNSADLNLTTYAVGEGTNLYVTIINKEHGAGGRAASVTIAPDGFSVRNAEVMFLTAPNNDAGATNGITLGGAFITNDSQWRGQWTTLPSVTNSHYNLLVPATSAAVVKLSAPKIR
jgi:hypothetical protein